MNWLEKAFKEGVVRVPEFSDPTSWRFIDLEPVKQGRGTPPPAYLARTDGVPLVYRGEAHVFVGPSETLKSWAAVLACRSVYEAGSRSLYVDFEDSAETFVERARIVGIPEKAIGTSVRYMRPDESALTMRAEADITTALDEFPPELVVLDGVTAAYALHGWDISKAEDAARWQHLVRRTVRASGATSIEVDRTGNDETPGAVGSQHKRAGLDGAQFTFSEGAPVTRGVPGYAYVNITKDRYGHIRPHAVNNEIGVLHVDPLAKGGPHVFIAPPQSASDKRAQQLGALVATICDEPGIATGPLAAKVHMRAGDVKRLLKDESRVRGEQHGNAHKWYPNSA
jgi:hypothetical protein